MDTLLFALYLYILDFSHIKFLKVNCLEGVIKQDLCLIEQISLLIREIETKIGIFSNFKVRVYHLHN